MRSFAFFRLRPWEAINRLCRRNDSSTLSSPIKCIIQPDHPILTKLRMVLECPFRNTLKRFNAIQGNLTTITETVFCIFRNYSKIARPSSFTRELNGLQVIPVINPTYKMSSREIYEGGLDYNYILNTRNF